MSKSAIEWTEQTWNPIVGCSIVSPGCTNCYAMQMASRIQKMNRSGGSNSNYVNHYDGTTKGVKGKIVWTGKLAMAPDKIFLQPLSRKAPTTYFVNSMGDLFHEDCPDEWIDRVFAVMALSPQHTFQVLTKRAARMRDYLTTSGIEDSIVEAVRAIGRDAERRARDNLSKKRVMSRDDIIGADSYAVSFNLEGGYSPWPLPNVWLGVSTERQQEADERIPLLLQTPAAVRFISAEPLLGSIDLTVPDIDLGIGRYKSHPDLDWVIVGGESGPNARPMHPDWATSLRDQCAAAGVAFFFKQWGSWYPSIDRDNDDPDWRRDYAAASIHPDRFKILNLAAGCGFHGERVHLMQRYSKKSCGRILDGELHDAMPAVRA